MITIGQLSISFSGRTLFDNVSFIIKDKDRIGLAGKNGAGKSTMLKILAGLQERDKGNIVITKGHEIGYLPQEMFPDSTKTILEEALTAFAKLDALETEITYLTNQLSERTDYESAEYTKIIERLSESNDRFNILNGANKRAETEKILLGLGFKHSDFSRSITEFSSGWQMRVELAKILLQKPEVMLLDEPTNHLDIESIEWLEGFLQSYFGSIVLISHDRKFLDNVTNRTIEIVVGKIEDYNVSYSKYVVQRAERRAIQQAAYSNQQKEIDDIERFVERFRYKASKAKQAQSRLKTLEKMDKIEIDGVDSSSIAFRFPPAPHSGKVVVRAQDLGKSYGDKNIFSGVDFILEKGEKVALVGKNGEGKSTFSKIIIGEITDNSGKMELGHQVKIGYFAQNQAALLDASKTVFTTIDDVAVGDVRTRVRKILGCFLFSGDDIEKRVKVLSGGEKTRLALAKLLLEPVNLLILDEPTNHLDMRSKDILKAALLQYDGSLIIVSHDRDFLEGLTTKVYEFKEKKVKMHIGDVGDFLSERKLSLLNSGKPTEVAPSPNKKPEQKVGGSKEREEKKNIDRDLRKKKNRVEKLEIEITELEAKLAEMDKVFIEQPKECTPENCRKYEKIKHKSDANLTEWETLLIELEHQEERS